MSVTERKRIIELARGWLGTKYHHQGRVRNHGVDCVGLLLGVFEELGLQGHDRQEFLTYDRRPPRGEGMLKYFDQDCGKRLKLEESQPADIAIFWINELNKRPQHIAIFTDYGIIHTYSDIGKVVEHCFTEVWKSRFICAYQFPCELDSWQH